MLTNPSVYKYEEIVRDISLEMENGSILAGEKLPSLRLMSHRYNCSISVVAQAYEILEATGFVHSVEKSGFFAVNRPGSPIPSPEKEHFSLISKEAVPLSVISRIITASNERSIVPLGAGLPDSSYLPLASLKREINSLMKEMPEILVDYTDEQGDSGLRQAVSRIMRFRGVEVEQDDILLTNGCTEALSLAIQSCSSPGDIIVLESPVFLGLIQLLKELKRRVITIPTSAETGMDLDALEHVLKKEDVKAVVMTALFQNPLGFVMPEENRKRAVFLVEKYDTILIEDDIYHDCSFKHLRDNCLKSYDKSGRVIYCSSFSKTISPAIRVGWICGGIHHRRCRNLKMAQTLGGCGLFQKALANFISSSGYERHILKLQKAMSRQAMEMSALLSRFLPENTAVSQPQGGYYLWVQLANNIDTLELFEKALAAGISIVPGPAFSPEERYHNCMRITFASPITSETEKGIERLSSLISCVT
ncbi:MAG: PLP-dependent aminotransferase family protein [Spirochaetales bacterium]|nr:PLP-dependent aminotransferase family protein [Spirochaetales bacterium]